MELLRRWFGAGKGHASEDAGRVEAHADVSGNEAIAVRGDAERSSASLVPRTQIAIGGIPPYRKDLLFITDEEPPRSTALMSFTLTADGELRQSTTDPSTIYRALPVSQKIPNEIPKLGYFPTYAGMTPDQRAVYLNWLRDITSPIDIGYVFVYYYGLERHLIYGDFEAAAQEIILLRKHHDQGSFNTYSSSALIHGCLRRGRADILVELYRDPGFEYFDNSSLLLLYTQNLSLTPHMLFRLALLLHIPGVTRKYIKDNKGIFRRCIEETLEEEFGSDTYAFAQKYDIRKVKGVAYAIFANISLPSEVRAPSLPNLLCDKPFQDEFSVFFRRVHEKTKRAKAERKKAQG
ncbi:hypothetical protein CIW54_28400 [Paraburkholderia sp. T12-10]|nr:hypothetical protein CIW54_28400 [Paraburkholderia sp. T12-10]